MYNVYKGTSFKKKAIISIKLLKRPSIIVINNTKRHEVLLHTKKISFGIFMDREKQLFDLHWAIELLLVLFRWRSFCYIKPGWTLRKLIWI